MRLQDFYPIIDVVQQIESGAGFWERYPPAR